MSNFKMLTKHPISWDWEEATWIDSYFGARNWGVEFSDGRIFDPRAEDLETKTEKEIEAERKKEEEEKKVVGNDTLDPVLQQASKVFFWWGHIVKNNKN